jgi:hypothetical protein
MKGDRHIRAACSIENTGIWHFGSGHHGSDLGSFRLSRKAKLAAASRAMLFSAQSLRDLTQARAHMPA